jgi:hypothetical protein
MLRGECRFYFSIFSAVMRIVAVVALLAQRGQIIRCAIRWIVIVDVSRMSSQFAGYRALFAGEIGITPHSDANILQNPLPGTEFVHGRGRSQVARP